MASAPPPPRRLQRAAAAPPLKAKRARAASTRRAPISAVYEGVEDDDVNDLAAIEGGDDNDWHCSVCSRLQPPPGARALARALVIADGGSARATADDDDDDDGARAIGAGITELCERLLMCEGGCFRTFHPICLGLTPHDVRIIRPHQPSSDGDDGAGAAAAHAAVVADDVPWLCRECLLYDARSLATPLLDEGGCGAGAGAGGGGRVRGGEQSLPWSCRARIARKGGWRTAHGGRRWGTTDTTLHTPSFGRL